MFSSKLSRHTDAFNAPAIETQTRYGKNSNPENQSTCHNASIVQATDNQSPIKTTSPNLIFFNPKNTGDQSVLRAIWRDQSAIAKPLSGATAALAPAKDIQM